MNYVIDFVYSQTGTILILIVLAVVAVRLEIVSQKRRAEAWIKRYQKQHDEYVERNRNDFN